MSNLIEFPLPDRPITEAEVDKLHSEAFRGLEGESRIAKTWQKSPHNSGATSGPWTANWSSRCSTQHEC